MSEVEEEASVKVALRIRPLSTKEQLDNNSECITYLPQDHVPEASLGQTETVLLDSTRPYTFDYVFRPNALQPQIYEACVKPMITSFLEGYNAAILAYGQTSNSNQIK
jgi:hypothetical protein